MERLPEQVMQALRELLAEAPEYRVGQALAIATARTTGFFDPFSVEDAALLKALQQLTAEARARKGLLFPKEGSLEAYVAEPHDGLLFGWIFNLAQWGHRPLALAAFAVAEPCLGIWQYGVPEDAPWQHHFANAAEPAAAMKALRQWLADPATPLEPHLKPLNRLIVKSNLIASDPAQSDERIGKRQRCVAAGQVLLHALNAAAWTPEQPTQGAPGEAERQEEAATRPHWEAWEAVRSFLAAHPEASEQSVREHVRRVVLAP
ncbi:hypothetical protein JYK02_13255 [Corallococcus macrosporus]|uniref:Uncharacterized protein n=1 Tax=Corallococcus macrosporus TaxID=35 RepID=A0ABS3DA11_9BACT|nr:hypothetical protein [Corallococcus macrosporus]MBN8228472.1 hypothetical protein [Corallococcus macrosporus]